MAVTPTLPAVQPLKAEGFYSFVVTIPDDDFAQWTPPKNFGHVFVASASNTHHGIAWYRGGQAIASVAGNDFNGTSGALTGTTGTDGKTTISANGGDIFLENRSGSSEDYIITMITFEDSVD